MCATWNEKFDPQPIVKRLDESKHFDDQGNFTGLNIFQSVDLLQVLTSTFDFTQEIPYESRFSLVRTAVFEEARTTSLTTKGVLRRVNREENKYLSEPLKDYIIAMAISLEPEVALGKKTIDGVRMIFSSFLPAKFDQSPTISIRQNLEVLENPDSYVLLRVELQARNGDEAMFRGLDHVDLLRGLWNLILNPSRKMSFNSPKQPLNQITLGSFHTVHGTDGVLIDKNKIWYEPEFVERRPNVKSRWSKVGEFEVWARKRLARHRYRKDIEDSIRRYVRALDYRDWHISFLQLWSLMETLTDTKRADYDKTIKRVSFHFEDTQLTQQVLQHLRRFRNESVHAALRTEQIEQFTYQLKDYVEALLFFHITNHFKFESIQNAAQLFELPTSQDFLKDRIKLARRAIKYRTPKEKSS